MNDDWNVPTTFKKEPTMNWGRVKVIFERARNYVGIGTQVASFGLLLMMNHISFWWVLGGVILFALFLWKVDLKRIYPAELEYAAVMNPEWVRFADKLDELVKTVDEMKKEMEHGKVL